jgi:hypothetical protein
MTLATPDLPLTVDPLIAAAKWRRRRRLRAAGVVLTLAAAVIVLGVELSSRDSSSVGGAWRTNLTLTAANGFGGRAVFHLTCHPAGGDLPHPASACAAIAAEPSLITRPKPFSCWGTWWNFSIIGRMNGRSVDTRISSCPSRQMALVEFDPHFAQG